MAFFIFFFHNHPPTIYDYYTIFNLNLIGDDSLRQDVGSLTDPQLGAGIVGMDGRLLRDYLKQQEYYLTVEYFGLTDTPINTRNTMQAAINFCAVNNVLLRNKAALYVIDVSEVGIKIPDNFMCDFGGAWIKRATGNATPHDMWSNANPAEGNFGLNIRGVNFDGQAQVDMLENKFPEQRFSGLRLIGCEGKLTNIRVDGTCNGEIQEEGTRGAYDSFLASYQIFNHILSFRHMVVFRDHRQFGKFLVGPRSKNTQRTDTFCD
jgi:hypothetical protein